MKDLDERRNAFIINLKIISSDKTKVAYRATKRKKQNEERKLSSTRYLELL